MIEFGCPECGKQFSVADKYAGRSATCKKCGTQLTVPDVAVASISDGDREALQEPSAAAEPYAEPKPERPIRPATPMPLTSAIDSRSNGSPSTENPSASESVTTNDALPSPRLPVRTRRLIAEAQQMRDAFANSEFIQITPIGAEPAERYKIDYTIQSIERLERETPIVRQSHEVEIQLTSEYPRFSPKCKMISPIFHPNIDETTICVGDHWTAGEKLTDLVIRIGEMLAYQAYNIKSPLNAEAAMWADLNGEKLPTDSSNIRPAGME